MNYLDEVIVIAVHLVTDLPEGVGNRGKKV